MRLLNTDTLQIKQFGDYEIPPYAILSHTWGDTELTFQDIVGVDPTGKEGYGKVRNSCSVAAAAGFEYIWIDTCCIDKATNGELSEAINSMYRWYQQAEVCYAYLADVPSGNITFDSAFSKSKWFTRGWTLQELLAPSEVIFVDKEWQKIGTKSSLKDELSRVTRIPVNALLGDDNLGSFSIAQRMSWAAKRVARKIEDRAYSLMGIFGINMPLIYGEGTKAFIRLQEEIIKISDDHSIFAWKSNEDHGGLLAPSPDAFEESGNIVPFNPFVPSDSRLVVGNKGVNLTLRFIGIGDGGLGLAILRCAENRRKDRLIAIYLRDVFLTMETFERIQSGRFEILDLRDFTPSQYPMRRIYVPQWRLAPMRKAKGVGIARQPIHLRSKGKPFHMMLRNLIDIREQASLFHTAKEEQAGAEQEDMEKLLLSRSDIGTNLKDEHGRTPLSHAAGGGHEAAVKLLLSRSYIQVDSKDGEGRTPLSHAAGSGHEAVVRLLLSRSNAQADSKDRKGRTPLSHAAEAGHEAVVWLLLTRSDVQAGSQDNEGWTPLSHAARGGHEAMIKLLLARSDIAPYLIDGGGRTPLSHASERGHETLVRLLLAQNDIQAGSKDIWNRTPLYWAAENGHEAVVKLLLETGAELEAKDKNERTSLLKAAENGHEAVVKLLLEKDAQIEAKDVWGQTPLTYAANSGYEAVVKLLLKAGARSNTRDEYNLTPLSGAAEKGHEAVVKLLLETGAEIEVKDVWGRTPLSWAVGNGHEGVVKLLRERSARNSYDPNL